MRAGLLALTAVIMAGGPSPAVAAKKLYACTATVKGDAGEAVTAIILPPPKGAGDAVVEGYWTPRSTGDGVLSLTLRYRVRGLSLGPVTAVSVTGSIPPDQIATSAEGELAVRPDEAEPWRAPWRAVPTRTLGPDGKFYSPVYGIVTLAADDKPTAEGEARLIAAQTARSLTVRGEGPKGVVFSQKVYDVAATGPRDLLFNVALGLAQQGLADPKACKGAARLCLCV